MERVSVIFTEKKRKKRKKKRKNGISEPQINNLQLFTDVKILVALHFC